MYISFSPYYSGLSNVIMSYELALSISYITNRTLILPKDCFIFLLSVPTNNDHDDVRNKQKFQNIFDLFDRSILEKEFDVIDLDKIEDFKDKKMDSARSYTRYISNYTDDIYCPMLDPNVRVLCEQHDVYVNHKDQYEHTDDFRQFVTDRRVIDLNRTEKYIHFENNLFGHYWYHVYPGAAEQRNLLKNKVNKVLTYNSILYEIASIVYKQLGTYNALHVRRNDFTFVRPNDIENINNGTKILNEIKSLYPTNVPLYISTDEPNKSFFDDLRKEYTIVFYENFDFSNVSALEKLAIEQIICSKAELFHGTFFSTYSKRIHVMRGLENKQTADYMGINQKNNIMSEKHKPFPWNKPNRPKWDWHDSSVFQWTQE